MLAFSVAEAEMRVIEFSDAVMWEILLIWECNSLGRSVGPDVSLGTMGLLLHVRLTRD